MIKYLPTKLVTTLRTFLKDSRSAGVILIVCTMFSLVLANLSPMGQVYVNWWTKAVFGNLMQAQLPNSLEGWINDVLMSFFSSLWVQKSKER